MGLTFAMRTINQKLRNTLKIQNSHFLGNTESQRLCDLKKKLKRVEGRKLFFFFNNCLIIIKV